MTADRSRCIGTLDVAVRSRDEAQRTILNYAQGQRPLLICFANAHSVNLAARDPSFRSAMGEALVLNDGIGVDLASSALHGRPFPDNLNGTDFVPALLAASGSSLRVFLIGGKPGVAERAASAIAALNPAIEIVGILDGYFPATAEDEQRRLILESKANLLLVALGQPLQELWAQRHWRAFAGPCLCVGALLDFLAGEVSRAPLVVRKLRLEWAYRLAQEPRRLASRYLIGNLSFIVRILRQRITNGVAS